VQGDEPMLDPELIRKGYELLRNPDVSIGTLAVEIKDESAKRAEQTVKAVLNIEAGADHGRALYFSRMPVPWGKGPLYQHIGLYAYRREALETFVKAKPAPLEKRESLEQLRALSLGLRIEVAVVAATSHPVDTPEDLEEVRKLMGKK